MQYLKYIIKTFKNQAKQVYNIFYVLSKFEDI